MTLLEPTAQTAPAESAPAAARRTGADEESRARRDAAVRADGGDAFAYHGETYYGRPAVKRSIWGREVGAYLFVSGMAGACQMIGAVATLASPARSRTLARAGRLLAMAGAASGAGLLIADLRTRGRWYNMLRIFRPTSPMSIGTYLLSAFGLLTGVTLLPEAARLRRDRPGAPVQRVAEVAQIPSALAGAGLTTYTAALLSSTSSPEWAAAPQHLGVQFAASAVASAAAALSVCEQTLGDRRNGPVLDGVAALATAVHLAASIAAESRRSSLGVREAAEDSRATARKRTADLVVAGALPLFFYALNAANGRSRKLSLFAAGAILAGHCVSRIAAIETGNESADRPRDYFRLARPDHLPALASGDRHGQLAGPRS